MRLIGLMLAAVLFTSVSSCQNDEVVPEGEETINLNEKSARLIEADNAFGLELFQKIRKLSDEENLMISPLSVSVALSMAYHGASGDTRTEMEKVLKIHGLTTEEINASYKYLITALQEVDKEVVFRIANAIFYAREFQIKPGFISINQDVYHAEVEQLDFSSPAAVQEINQWVAEKTNQKIQKIIEQLDPLDRMVLLNAIYFYASWTNEFDKDGTQLLPFTQNDGTLLEVAMMQKVEMVPFTSNTLFKAIKIPYGKGKYHMVVLLPQEGKNSGDVIDALSAENWKAWFGQMESSKKVQITMPRFKYAFESHLKEVLQIMGMSQAFNAGQADFSLITDEDLYISEAIHKSYIDVNETGTEAAAVTGLVFTTTSIDPDPPIPFRVDKPFVYAITEEDTGAILFIGEVNHPTYEITDN